MKYREDDLSLLLPSFRERVESLLEAMRTRGFTPCFRDGYRTPEEAERNAVKRTGIANSMHCYGAAADIICGLRGWKHPEFFKALGEEAEKLGLTWGGRWTRRDFPHVQGVRLKHQATLRSLPVDERDAFVRSCLEVQ